MHNAICKCTMLPPGFNCLIANLSAYMAAFNSSTLIWLFSIVFVYPIPWTIAPSRPGVASE